MLADVIKNCILAHNWNIYDVAVMTDAGIETAQCRVANAANDGFSTAKLFTDTAVAVLWDRGEIDLDAPLTTLLGDEIDFDYDPAWDQVTLRHALSHKMGIDRGVLDVDVHDTNAIGTDDYLRYMFGTAPVYEPGTVFQYSDVAHYLVSRAVAKHTGRKIDEILRAEIFPYMAFHPVAFRCCPKGYPLGATGMYMTTEDLVKLPWLYLNRGVYGGRRLISEAWVEKTERERFDWNPQGETGFWGKGGMNGQNMLAHAEKRIAIAWHGCLAGCRDDYNGIIMRAVIEAANG